MVDGNGLKGRKKKKKGSTIYLENMSDDWAGRQTGRLAGLMVGR